MSRSKVQHPSVINTSPQMLPSLTLSRIIQTIRVRTTPSSIRLKQKFDGIGLNVDEVIELYTAEAYLYPSPEVKARLKAWKKDKERYERLGILTDEPVMVSTGAKLGEEEPVVNEDAN